MRQASAEVIAFGVGVAISPVAIITVVLLLVAPHGRRSGLAFLAAWALSLATAGTIVLLLADGADARSDGGPADWVIVAQMIIAVLLVIVGARQWHGRPRGDAVAEQPAWMRNIDTMTASRAARLAVLLAAVKPKNLLLSIGAAVAIAETGVGAGAQAGALAVFVLLGSIGPGVPVAISLFMGERAAPTLAGLRDWMIRENATIIAVLCLVLAAKLLGDSIGSLS